MDSNANPVKVQAANEDGEVFADLEIVSKKKKNVVVTLPYLSALRYIILKVSGGNVSEDDPQELPIVVFDSPAVLDEETGDADQVGSNSSSSIFAGPQGPQGEKGATGSTGATGASGASILGLGNTFTGSNIFSGAVTTNSTVTTNAAVEVSSSLSANGTTTFNGTTIIQNGELTITSSINGANPLIFEGATNDAFETTLAVTDPTADSVVTLPNGNGDLALLQRDITLNNVINGTSGTAYALQAANGSLATGVLVVDANSDGGGGAGTLTTLTGASVGQIAILTFSNATAGPLTITDNTPPGADQISLSAAFGPDADDDRLILIHTGLGWVEIGREEN